MGLVKLESLLGNKIEGFFNSKFSSALEPAELVRSLKQEVVRHKRKTEHGTVVPNDYSLILGEEDYQRLCAARVMQSLYEGVERKVIKEDCVLSGKLQIRMGKKAGEKGLCEILSKESSESSVDLDEPNTIVLERRKFEAPLNLPPEHEIARIRVKSGPDVDAKLVIGVKQVYIGRRDKNEFILTDVNASRIHAYISYEGGRHVLHDAGSTNGTFVGLKRVESQRLRSGDEFKIGSTVLVYEVI
ncbi:MAG TPA: DUF2662 domain-containing protein [Selenomonas sp.]|nr:DUF2662 domain-containing protein [Selenomonas sp.]